MLLTVCIEAGRSTLTHTSWTGLAPVSRKWMSGQAAALAATKDRTPFPNLVALLPLRDRVLPSVRRPPSPLDCYLSWMSPGFPNSRVLGASAASPHKPENSLAALLLMRQSSTNWNLFVRSLMGFHILVWQLCIFPT